MSDFVAVGVAVVETHGRVSLGVLGHTILESAEVRKKLKKRSETDK